MAAKQRIIWTALPKSSRGTAGGLVVSVHVAPRLQTGGPDSTLEEFPDWVDWPSTPKSFAVSFGGGEPQAATVVSNPAAGSNFWKALFGKSTFVRGRDKVDAPREGIRSYPVARTLEYIVARYTSVLNNATTDPPSFDALKELFGDIVIAGTERQATRDQLMKDLDAAVDGPKRAYTFADGSKPGAIDMFALERFFERGKASSAPFAPVQVDFHQTLAAANAHALLLRLLGLVIDIEVDSFSFSSPLTTDIRVIPTWGPSLKESVDVTPRTRCLIDDEVFVATPGDAGEYDRGHLRLGDSTRFNLVQIDQDGAGLKLLNFTQNLAQSRVKKSDDTPTNYTVPSLRGAGLSVARADRGVQFAEALATGGKLNEEIEAAGSSDHPFLNLEEVTRGWYIDVWDETSKQWHSLCRRTGALKFTATEEEFSVPPTDEAPVAPLPTQSADPSMPPDMYMQETLFQWQGWSLAAAQPGNHILAKDEAGEPPETPGPIALKFDYRAAPGSLPRLRFGQRYRVRMRAADLAGNAIPPGLATRISEPDLYAEIDFKRFEPIRSPVLVPRAPSTPGESVERMVIRSNYKPEPETPTEDERYVVPGRASQRMAEFHGLFDVTESGESVLNPDAYQLIVARESKHIEGVQDPNGPAGALYTDQLTQTPYLPDAIARGAAFQGLPGTTPGPTGLFTVDFAKGKPWPEYNPFRVILRQSANELGPAGPPEVGSDETGPYLIVELAKADIFQVRLSSTLYEEDLSLLGVWAWRENAEKEELQAKRGEVWMLTPFQVLTLVHAVRQPLLTPEFTVPHIERQVGQTFAVIADRLTFSRKSTAKIEVNASWDEPIDEGPGAALPKVLSVVGSVAFPVDLAAASPEPPVPSHVEIAGQHHFYDTKHRSITYSALATTAFADYFTQTKRITAKSVPFTEALDGGGVVPGSVTARLLPGAPPKKGGPLQEGPEKDFTVDAAAGTITVLAGGAAEEDVDVSFLTPPIARESEKPRLLEVPSSARPPAPAIVYVVPTFTWNPEPEPEVTSTRKGGGLRVYMERPWFASGSEEMLGVVLWPGGPSVDPPDALTPYVTGWGQDPLFGSAQLPSRHPSAASFPLASQKGEGLPLDELKGQLVNVAGHTIDITQNFDAGRDLWFCDIDVEIGQAYTPFIRLALARYQRSSVQGEEGDISLSRVVLADFMQLAPDRSASVTVKGGLAVGGTRAGPAIIKPSGPTLVVNVFGPSYSQVKGPTKPLPGPGVLYVTLQRRNPKIDASNELGWEDVYEDPFVAKAKLPKEGPATWTANVPLPGPRTPGLYRLVLEQFEELPSDNAKGVQQRIVYTDVLPV
jgi:hypothetical protein